MKIDGEISHRGPTILLATAWILVVLSPVTRAEPTGKLPPPARGKIDFRTQVYPILKGHCFDCHRGRDSESGYRLDQRLEILGQTNGEPLAVIGKSNQSRLILAAARLDPDIAMPPAGEGEPLTDKQLSILRAWIDQGLRWDETLLPAETNASHWAFQSIRRPALPQVNNHDWLLTPVDNFIAAGHQSRNLSPGPPASRQTLIRRLSLDLRGLPPTPEEIDRFVNDRGPDAYEQLVDRMLASPRYGERWGRHWLDVARWAESEGYESNHLRPYAWRYRDYVVSSFNRDKPYDRFLREQIAGDELLPYRDENLIATGFLAAARLSSNEEDKRLQRNDALVDIVNATGSAVLGLTVRCAQCHNHKFDPITQRDYYALQGFFVRGQVNNVALRDKQLWGKYYEHLPPGHEEAVKLRDLLFEQAKQRTFQEVQEKLTPEMVAAMNTPLERRTAGQLDLARQAELKFQFTPKGFERRMPEKDKRLYDELNKKITELEKQGYVDRPQTWAFHSPATSNTKFDVLPMKAFYPLPYEPEKLKRTDPFIYVRGDVHRPGPKLTPGWPVVLGKTTDDVSGDTTRNRLVDWLVDRDNPLTARVWANRIWQHHFGRGLVATPGDFGLKGASPTHPKLLDWLAAELIDSRWSTKHMHRLILLSAVYRQASQVSTSQAEIDSDNRYLWHYPPRRLEAEALRDATLSAGGELDLTMGGRGVEDSSSPRRSLYLLQKRDRFPEIQRLFDGPTSNESCSRRYVSTVALQPLYLLNNPFMLARAEKFAQRVRRRAGNNVEKQIVAAFTIALGRAADQEERQAALEFFAENNDNGTNEKPTLDKLVEFCHALLNLNEFAYLE